MDNALQDLVRQLASVLSALGPFDSPMGKATLVERPAREAEKVFQGSSKSKPSKESARAAALALSRNLQLDDFQYHLVAGALSVPLPERQETCALESRNIDALFEHYEAEAKRGELWRLTWFGLLSSYFDFNSAQATPAATAGWEKLRALLQRTWPGIDRHCDGPAVPDWVSLLRSDPELIGKDATRRYAVKYLQGDETEVQRLSADLGIPESSWFWQALVLSAVHQAASQSDQAFKAAIPRLIGLLKLRPVFRDDSLELILTRYLKCSDRTIHEELRDYVVHKDVWKNPKLKAAGIATTWNRVSNDVWLMVLHWVNESNLRDFFEILATRHNADEGRLAFWSRYLDQISWTRLIFSAETKALANRNRHVRELIAREEGAYATLTGTKNVDAFMMQIGDYLVVEFSTTGNAAYVYESEKLKFNRHAGSYHGGTEDLRYGYHKGSVVRIVHRAPWEHDARIHLQNIGIYPDDDRRARTKPAAPHVTPQRPNPATATSANPKGASIPRFIPEAHPVDPPQVEEATQEYRPGEAPPGAPFTMSQLQTLVQGYRRAYIKDYRSEKGAGGRLWVEDPLQRDTLAAKLRTWGFVWAQKRSAHYYPES